MLTCHDDSLNTEKLNSFANLHDELHQHRKAVVYVNESAFCIQPGHLAYTRLIQHFATIWYGPRVVSE